MKKLSIFLLAVLLTVSLFVSCDNTTKAVTDERVAVTFSTGADSRSLSYAIEDVSELNWYYTAQKNSADTSPFSYGATTAETPITLGSRVEFSQGLWDFTLLAKRVDNGVEGATVYQGSITGVLITKADSPKNIVIDVFPSVEGSTGSIKLNGVTITLRDTESTQQPVFANKAVIKGKGISINGEEIRIDGTSHIGEKTGLTPGDYDVTVMYTHTVGSEGQTQELVYASETITVTVWSGRTTTVSGNLSELTGSAIINGDIKVPSISTIQKTVSESAEPTVFSANVAPSNNAQSTTLDKTTVAFEFGALDEGTYNLSVEVSNDVENGNINIESTRGTAATLNLSLKNGENDVTTFNEKTVTITTYIAKGLRNVSVTGPSDATITDVSYTSETGKLVFTTNHFSKYKVIVNGVRYEAYNATTKKAYEKLYSSDQTTLNAFSEASIGDTIVVLQDIELDEKIMIEKSITIEGQGFGISCGTGVDRVIDIQNNTNSIRLIINDLDIVGPTNGEYTRGLSANKNTGELYIELNNCEVSASYYALNIAGLNSNVKVVANNCVAIGGWCAVQTWSANSKFEFNNCELIGKNDKSYNAVGWNDFGTVVVNEDSVNSSFTFNNSIIKAIETTRNIQTAFDIRGKNTTIEMNSSTIELKGKNAYSYVDKGENNTVLKDGNSVNLHLAETFGLNAENVSIADDHTSATGKLVITYLEKDYPFTLENCPKDVYSQGTCYICRAKGASSLLAVEFDVSTEYGETNSWCGVSSCEFIK